MTFHDLSIVLAGAFTAASCLISFIAYMRQALHFSNPNEQTKYCPPDQSPDSVANNTNRILRIIALIPAYAIISFLSVAFPNAATYLEPWTDVYESAALASFFLLLLIYLVPVPEKQEAYFDRLPSQNAKGEATGGGSLGWFHVRSPTQLTFSEAYLLVTENLDLRLPILLFRPRRSSRCGCYASRRRLLRQFE